jgi:hypothetical protein
LGQSKSKLELEQNRVFGAVAATNCISKFTHTVQPGASSIALKYRLQPDGSYLFI